mgnify:CR=1 FL=1
MQGTEIPVRRVGVEATVEARTHPLVGAAVTLSASVQMMTNSSPPKRAIRPRPCTTSSSRSATAGSNWSPTI